MHDLLTSLIDKELIATEQQKILDHNFSSIAKKLIESHIANAKVQPNLNPYSDEVKQFVVTLHYYSLKAYEFVHQVLKLSPTSRIWHWAASVNCEPGYLTYVIMVIGLAANTDHSMADAVLVIDALVIHKGTFWDPKKWQYVGNVNYGTAVPEACENPSTEALVFLAVGLREFLKQPIAYILQDKCSAKVQVQRILDFISLLHAEGINVHGVVFDGAFTNQ